MDTSRPRLSILVTAFLLTGLVADMVPHPALGPGIIRLGLNALAPEEAAAETFFERSPHQLSTVESDQDDEI
ncbi:MAG: hypothetical protein ACFB8W_11780 [Elainellaceae cyanobacterium]